MIGLGLLWASAPAHAQEPPGLQSPAVAEPSGTAPADADTGADARAGEPLALPDTAPVLVLDRAALEAAGEASLGDILQDLPQQSGGINSQVNNGGDGTTRIDLRGLGASRTLVLVNGRRQVAGGSGANASVDLSAIPLAAVERVEVRGAGGSTLHGAGAIGGVVDIITRQDLDHTEAAAYLGTTEAGGGTTYDLSVATGATSRRGHILLSAGYHEQQPIGAGERGFSRFDHRYGWETGEVYTVGSTAVPQGIIIDYYDPESDGPEYEGNQAWQDLRSDTCQSGACYNDPSTGWRDVDSGGTSDTGEGDYYNYQPENYLLTPRQRYSVLSTGRYELLPRLAGFFEASYTNRTSEQRLASTPLFTVSEGIIVSGDNAYNPFGRDFRDVRRRMVEAGNRGASQDVATLRLVAGVEGSLPALASSHWSLAYSYGRTQADEVRRGELIRSRLASALGPSFMDTDGTLRCGTPDAPGDPACVPLNLFGGPVSITPDMVDYVAHTGTASGQNELHQVLLDTAGTLLKLPAGGDVTAHAGARYRKESGEVSLDARTAAGDTTGSTVAAVAGGFDATEVYGALSVVPLVDEPLIERLALHGAVRAFDYSTAGSGQTWELGALWRIISGLSVHGTRATAMRAPSVRDLYAGQSESFPNVRDPCDTSFGPISPAVQASCAVDGVSDDFVDARTQLEAVTGGNPDVGAETADILTAGMAFEPAALPGVALTADYYSVELANQIQSVGAAAILDDCYRSGERNRCDQIVRDPATGLITTIDDRVANSGGIETAGVDIGFHYHTGTPSLGLLRLDLLATFLQKHDQVQPDGRRIEGRGVHDLGVRPARKLSASVQLDRTSWGAGANVRYIGSIEECEDDDCSNELDPRRTVSANLTADLFASYRLRSPAGLSQLTVGVNNVTGQAPPTIYNSLTANSDPRAYDFRGRYVYARFVQRF